MNAIELLKEARAELAKAHDHLMELTAKLPMRYFGLIDGDIIQAQDYFVDRLDAYLAAPSESAMEIVEKIREKKDYNTDLGRPPRMGYTLIAPEAAALIESYGRRVPRKMLDIIYFEGMYDGEKGRDRSTMHLFDDIAAKYGVEVEG